MPLLVRPFKEKKSYKTNPPLEAGLEITEKGHRYETFPKFDAKYFYEPREIEVLNKDDNLITRCQITNEDLEKMNDAEWARYFTEIIYVLWY